MNWHAALFGFMLTIGIIGACWGIVLGVEWAGETYGPVGAAIALVLLLAAAIGIGMGVSER